MLQLCRLLAVLCLLAAFAQAAHPLEELTGARTKMVWVRDEGNAKDVFGTGNRLRLMLLDTGSHGGREQSVLPNPRACAKPMLTPDGNRIVFSDGTTNAYMVVDTDGNGLRKAGDGFAMELWAEPGTGRIWVYSQQRRKGKKKEDNPIRRALLDGKGPGEVVWNRTQVSVDNFQLSRDGKLAAGLFPWPKGGVAELPNKGWQQRGGGCWTSLAPDNSGLFWIFDGPHRNVTLVTSEGRRWKTCIGDGPGINGFEVYHPRWSNHPRIFACTGPYLGSGGRPGGNRIGAGGKAVELYVGRFSKDLTKVEQWVQVTRNKKADFLPDVWVEGGAQHDLARSVVGNELPESISEVELRRFYEWPGTSDGLVFLWENRSTTNEIPVPGQDAPRICKLRELRKAIYGPNQGMLTAGGAFAAQDVDDALLRACKASNALTVEATIATDSLDQAGPARIISFSTDSGSRNFTLGQQKDHLVFRLRTPKTGDNGTGPEAKLGRITPGEPVHVLVTYTAGRLVCYQNGRAVRIAETVDGDFSNWSPHHLLFGDEWTGQRDWHGRIEGIAIWSRAMGPAEAARRYELNRKRMGARAEMPRLVVDARLVAKSATPTPISIAPYRRCLAEYSYDIIKVREGTCTVPRISVAHWVILDGQALNRTSDEGTAVRLVLEPFDRHPELTGERLVSDLDEFDLPVYYDAAR